MGEIMALIIDEYRGGENDYYRFARLYKLSEDEKPNLVLCENVAIVNYGVYRMIFIRKTSDGKRWKVILQMCTDKGGRFLTPFKGFHLLDKPLIKCFGVDTFEAAMADFNEIEQRLMKHLKTKN